MVHSQASVKVGKEVANKKSNANDAVRMQMMIKELADAQEQLVEQVQALRREMSASDTFSLFPESKETPSGSLFFKVMTGNA